MILECDEAQAKQFIDALQLRRAWLSAERDAQRYRGSVFWRSVKGRDYLIKEMGRSDKSLGPRSPETEMIHEEFRRRKAETTERYQALRAVVQRQQRMNVALRVGHAPNLLVSILETLREAGVDDHFMVIGTNALYAYEFMAGVRFSDDLTATVDIDLLWDSRKHFTLVSHDPDFNAQGLIGLLKKADRTFKVHEDEAYRASNNAGFMVDLIRRRPASLLDDVEASQVVRHEEEFWAAKIRNMDWLLSSPKVKQTIVSINGAMAEMTTVDPRAYVLFKRYMADQDDRDPLKKPRDRAQAAAVMRLLDDYLPQYAMRALPYFPARLQKNMAPDDDCSP